jgi:predicted RNase H-like nuclease (RuvC/YqgF family)
MHARQLAESIGSARTRVDDLQAEIEAGARWVDQIHAEADALEQRLMRQMEFAAQLGSLRQHSRELRASMTQQRSILRQLRRSLNEIRQALGTRHRSA